MPRFYESVDAKLDINPSDYWEDCSNSEKQELANRVIDEGYGSKERSRQTYTEECLSDLLDEIWENRIHVDMAIVDRLRAQLKAERIL
jgi:hypothetical protein